MHKRQESPCDCGGIKSIDAAKCRECWLDGRREAYAADSIKHNTVRGPLPEPGQAAIYLLRDEDNKVFYVGSSLNPKDRIYRHQYAFGKSTTMIIVKIVDEAVRWEEEILATVEYSKFVRVSETDTFRRME